MKKILALAVMGFMAIPAFCFTVKSADLAVRIKQMRTNRDRLRDQYNELYERTREEHGL
jgi:hypothetical protein